MIKIIFTVYTILMLLFLFLRVSFDKTTDGKILLWYGRNKRKYIVLWG